MCKVNGRRTPSDGKSSHCLWQGHELKRTNNDLQNTKQKTKALATQTPLKTTVNSGVLEGKAIPAPLVTPVMLL